MQSEPAKEKYHPFIANIQEVRRRAREHMKKGAVTEGYKADRETVLRVLNEALATEIVCVLRYKRHYFLNMLAEQITQWNGKSDLNPGGLTADCHSQYVEGKSLLGMIREDLAAGRIAIESYNEILRYLGNDDSTSRIMMANILAMEEEHADDMDKLLETLSQDERFAGQGN
jgi:bacterioferritin